MPYQPTREQLRHLDTIIIHTRRLAKETIDAILTGLNKSKSVKRRYDLIPECSWGRSQFHSNYQSLYSPHRC